MDLPPVLPGYYFISPADELRPFPDLPIVFRVLDDRVVVWINSSGAQGYNVSILLFKMSRAVTITQDQFLCLYNLWSNKH